MCVQVKEVDECVDVDYVFFVLIFFRERIAVNDLSGGGSKHGQMRTEREGEKQNEI